LTCMIVQRRSLFDDRIHIGNGDQDLYSPIGPALAGFGNGKLAQIKRIIVVDKAPEKGPEIAGRFLSSRRRHADFVELGKRPRQKNPAKVLFQASPGVQSFLRSCGVVFRLYSPLCHLHRKYPVTLNRDERAPKFCA